VDVSPGGSEVPLGPLAVAVLAALVLVGGFTWLRFRFQRRK
jgi:hypothetical protein